MKPVCILVAGIFASGKSRTAATLSQELGITLLSKDELKEILFDTVGFRSREEKVQLGIAAQQILLTSAQRMLKSKSSVILENNFESSSETSLLDLLNRVEVTYITLMLKGDIPTLYQRFIQRNHTASRHPGHVINRQYPFDLSQDNHPEPEMTLEQFTKSVESRGMTTFHVPGYRLELDVTNWSNVNLSLVVQQLRHIIQEIQEE